MQCVFLANSPTIKFSSQIAEAKTIAKGRADVSETSQVLDGRSRVSWPRLARTSRAIYEAHGAQVPRRAYSIQKLLTDLSTTPLPGDGKVAPPHGFPALISRLEGQMQKVQAPQESEQETSTTSVAFIADEAALTEDADKIVREAEMELEEQGIVAGVSAVFFQGVLAVAILRLTDASLPTDANEISGPGAPRGR